MVKLTIEAADIQRDCNRYYNMYNAWKNTDLQYQPNRFNMIRRYISGYLESIYRTTGYLRNRHSYGTAGIGMGLRTTALWANSCLLYTSPSPRD